MLPSSDEPDRTTAPAAESAVPNLIGPLAASMAGGVAFTGVLVASGAGLALAALAYPLVGSLILFTIVAGKMVARAMARPGVSNRGKTLAQG